MPSNIQVDRHVQLNSANISETTELTINNLLKKSVSIILKSDNVHRTDRLNRNAHCYHLDATPVVPNYTL